jgi:DNA-binding transcriptional ArsR family regulator
MKPRKKTNPETEAAVLTRSRRRCCICFGLHRDVEVKAGQIAHLDGDRSNGSEDNLAFLCLVHHDEYDSRTSQSKNLTIDEVKAYRRELYAQVIPVIETGAGRISAVAIALSEPAQQHFDAHRNAELKAIATEVIAGMHGVLRSVTMLAHRLSIAAPAADRLLYELAAAGVLRVDRPKGTMRKTYSLAGALENRMLDTFVSRLSVAPISDERFIVRRQYELDALVRTDDETEYAVETMYVRERLTREGVIRRIQQLDNAKKVLAHSNSVGVLLIGITKETKTAHEDLRDLERPDLLIRYVEVEEVPNNRVHATRYPRA